MEMVIIQCCSSSERDYIRFINDLMILNIYISLKSIIVDSFNLFLFTDVSNQVQTPPIKEKIERELLLLAFSYIIRYGHWLVGLGKGKIRQQLLYIIKWAWAPFKYEANRKGEVTLEWIWMSSTSNFRDSRGFVTCYFVSVVLHSADI